MKKYDNIIVFPGCKNEPSIILNNPKLYRKKPTIIQAEQMQEDFSISTLEWSISWKAGDYVVLGNADEFYTCRTFPKEIFEQIYDLIEEDE